MTRQIERTETTGARRGRRPSRALLALVAVLRLVSVLVAVELSGAVHAALDVVASLAGEQHVEDDCDDSGAGHECPPGCPNCHAAHAALAAPLLQTPERPAQSLSRAPQVHFARLETREPRHPDRGSLYRPPRLDSSPT